MNDRNYLDIKACTAEQQTKDPILDAIELLNFTKEIIAQCTTCAQKMRDRE